MKIKIKKLMTISILIISMLTLTACASDRDYFIHDSQGKEVAKLTEDGNAFVLLGEREVRTKITTKVTTTTTEYNSLGNIDKIIKAEEEKTEETGIVLSKNTIGNIFSGITGFFIAKFTGN